MSAPASEKEVVSDDPYSEQRTEPHPAYDVKKEFSVYINLWMLGNTYWHLKRQNVLMSIRELESPEFCYQVEIHNPSTGTDPNKVLLQFFITSHIVFTFKTNKHCLEWNLPIYVNHCVFRAEFLKPEQEESFAAFWNQAFFEVAHKADLQSVCRSEADRKWILQPSLDTSLPSKAPHKSMWNASERNSRHKAKNALLVENLLHHQIYVAQDQCFDAYQFTHNHNELKHLGKFPLSSVGSDHCFQPSQIMLMDESTKMLLLNPANTTKVTEIDLEICKVVREYGSSNEWQINQIAPMTKLETLTGQMEFLGINDNSVFSIDPRQHGIDKLAQVLSYSDAPHFSCITSSESGKIATGTSTGEIRLYADISKRAKTLLPGLGDAITGLDITEDDQWVIATTTNYLLLIPTTHETESYNGFQRSVSQHSRPPIKLQLKPEDMLKYNIRKLNFTRAHFNWGDNTEEWIVTSTGPYLVSWNFSELKENHSRYDYQIKFCGNNVLANNFRFQNMDQVLVALPSDVYIEKRIQIKSN